MKTKRVVGSLLVVGMAVSPLFAAVADLKNKVQPGKVPYLVVGSKAKSSDVLAAADLAFALAALSKKVETVTKEVTVKTGEKGLLGGVKLYKDTDKIELGESLTGGSIYSISNELVFKNGVIKDKDNTEYYYTVRFKPSTYATVKFEDKPDTDEKDPTLLIDGSSNEFYTIEVTFTPSLPKSTVDSDSDGINDLEEKELNTQPLNIAGKTYYLSEVADNKLVLREASNVVTLDVGETYNFEGKKVKLIDVVKQKDEYYVVIDVDGNQETVKVNDEATVGGIDIKVLNAWVSETQAGKAYAKVILGGKKIELQAGNPVKVGNEEIDNTEVESAGPTGFKVKVYVNKDDTTKNYLENGKELVDPVFGTFKLVFGKVDLEAGKEKIKVYASGEEAYVKLPLGEGEKTFKIVDSIDSGNLVVDEDWKVAYSNSEFTSLPDDTNMKVLTIVDGYDDSHTDYVAIYWKDTSGKTHKPYFVVSLPSRETYIYQVNSVTFDTVDSKEVAKVELKDVVTGNTFTVNVELSSGEGTADFSIGGVTFRLKVKKDADSNTDGDQTLVQLEKVKVSDSTNEYLMFYTKDGHKVYVRPDSRKVYVGVEEFQGEGKYVFAGLTELSDTSGDGKVDVEYKEIGINATDKGDDNTIDVQNLLTGVWKENIVTVGDGDSGKTVDVVIDNVKYKITYSDADSNANSVDARVDKVERLYPIEYKKDMEDNEFKALDQWGTYVHGDQENDGDGYAEFYVPNEKVWYDIRLYKADEEVKEGNGEKTVSVELQTEKLVPVEPKYTFTDDECMGSCTGKAVVAVGGPCVNKVTKMFANEGKLPACGSWQKNKAVLAKFVENGVEYYVVAGYEALDTRIAAKVLAYYLEGMKDELPSEVVNKLESEDVVWLDTSNANLENPTNVNVSS